MAAVNVSHTPSSISLTVVARNCGPSRGLLAPGQQVVDLAEAAAAVPPQRADHVAAEHAVVGGHAGRYRTRPACRARPPRRRRRPGSW